MPKRRKPSGFPGVSSLPGPVKATVEALFPPDDPTGGLFPGAVAPTITRKGALNLLRSLHRLLPEDVMAPLQKYMGSLGGESRAGLMQAVEKTKAHPDLLAQLRAELEQELGPQFPVFRGTSANPPISPMATSGLLRPASYSLFPGKAAMFGDPSGDLFRRVTGPQDFLLPGVTDEFELILDRISPDAKGVFRREWHPMRRYVDPYGL